MAEFASGQVVSFKGNATIAAYRVLTGGATATAKQVGYWATQTSHILGVSLQLSKETGSSVPVVISGIAKCICNASVSAWELVGPATDGSGLIVARANPTTVTTLMPKTLGLALENGSTNSVIAVALQINNRSFAI